MILSREGTILGVTSAAAIWVTAAIGACVGLGHFAAAIAISLVTVAILKGLDALEERVAKTVKSR